jgi:hypothetical protein
MLTLTVLLFGIFVIAAPDVQSTNSDSNLITRAYAPNNYPSPELTVNIEYSGAVNYQDN